MGALQFFVRSSKRHYRVSPSPAAEVNSSAKVGNNGSISRQLAPISSTLHCRPHADCADHTYRHTSLLYKVIIPASYVWCFIVSSSALQSCAASLQHAACRRRRPHDQSTLASYELQVWATAALTAALQHCSSNDDDCGSHLPACMTPGWPAEECGFPPGFWPFLIMRTSDLTLILQGSLHTRHWQ